MKKNIKKLMALLLAVTLVFGFAGITGVDFADFAPKAEAGGEDVDPGDYTEGLFRYSVRNNEAYLCKCDSSASGNIVIPSTLGGYPVVRINEYAFRGLTGITGIVISDTVLEIGHLAFSNCTSLNVISLPDTLTKIGSSVFENTAYYNNKNNYINSILYICNYIVDANQEASYSKIVIKEGTLGIADYAFGGCVNVKEFNIPNSVKFVGSGAFNECKNLTKVNLPDNLKIIESWLFNECSSLTSIEIPNTVTKIDSRAFSECILLSEINIPLSVIEIGDHAFEDCESLTSFEFPANIKSVNSCIFRGCSSLESVIIPEGVENIDAWAFDWCTSLKNIQIPESVKEISYGAFNYCTSLEYAVVPDGVEYLGDYTFTCCDSLEYVHIPASVTSMYESQNGVTPFSKSPAYLCSDTADCYVKTYAEEHGLTFKVCDGHGMSESHSHSYKLINTVSPSCTDNGVKVYICECGD